MDGANETFSIIARRQQAQKKFRATVIAIITMTFVASVLAIAFPDPIAPERWDSSRGIKVPDVALIRITASAFIILCLGGVTYIYTSGRTSRLYTPSDTAGMQVLDVQTLAEMVDAVRSAAEEIRASHHITNEDRAAIREQLEEIVRISMPTEVLACIDKKYGGAIKNEAVSESIKKTMGETIERLKLFQKDLSEKANASQAWALTTAALGVIVLVYFISYNQNSQSDDAITRTFHYTTRVGLIALIEYIAFFYFRQFRSALHDCKYIANEITNIEMRLSAITSSLKLGSTATSKILLDIAKIERNFALKKGETSIFHSATESDMMSGGAIADIFGKIAAAGSKGK